MIFFFCGFARASFRFDSRIGVDAARAGPCATQTTVSKLELEGFCVPQSCEGPLFSVARYCQDKKTATGHAALRRVFCERRARPGYSGRQWLHVSFLKHFPLPQWPGGKRLRQGLRPAPAWGLHDGGAPEARKRGPGGSGSVQASPDTPPQSRCKAPSDYARWQSVSCMAQVGCFAVIPNQCGPVD